MGLFRKSLIKKMVLGRPTVDGDDMQMVRLLSANTVYDFDPFLMLDAFDSGNPKDYAGGLPMHPHRGIECFTYLVEGNIDHCDTLGRGGCIAAGDAQWITAGSGIMHREMPRLSPSMLGFQLWLNLSGEDKMVEPEYLSIKSDDIPEIVTDSHTIRIISGSYAGEHGARTRYTAPTILDIALNHGKSFELEMNPQETAFIFLLKGDALLDKRIVVEKTAVLLDTGQKLTIRAQDGQDLRLFYFSAKPLGEPIAWGGPIVMNTQEELYRAITDIKEGTFVRA
ncbi:MAG TPA: pirin family protein [Coriobacteriia bacterium]|nr:pirin family protein [Coriobacteriia bacterium]